MYQWKMVLTEQQVLLNIIFRMEVKKSLVPAENDKIAVAGGVQWCPPIPDIYASTVPSHSFAEQMLIAVDI